MGKWSLVRQATRRAAAAENEVHRRALVSVARNTTLPAQVRHRAQLALNAHKDGQGRLGQVNSVCTETGKARGVIAKYGLCRVSTSVGME